MINYINELGLEKMNNAMDGCPGSMKEVQDNFEITMLMGCFLMEKTKQGQRVNVLIRNLDNTITAMYNTPMMIMQAKLDRKHAQEFIESCDWKKQEYCLIAEIKPNRYKIIAK